MIVWDSGKVIFAGWCGCATVQPILTLSSRPSLATHPTTFHPLVADAFVALVPFLQLCTMYFGCAEPLDPGAQRLIAVLNKWVAQQKEIER